MSSTNPFLTAQGNGQNALSSFANSANPANSGSSANAGGWAGLFAGIGDLYGANQLGNQNYPNPANAAMPYFQQIPGAMSPYYQPYMQAGQNAMGNLQGQYGQLNNILPGLMQRYGQMQSNPSQVLQQIGGQYQQSPGYQFQTSQALNAANRAAAAGGMLGSPQEQQQIAGTVNNLANQDYYQYLNNAEGIMGQGLQGQSNLYGEGLQGQQQMTQTGFQGSNELAQSIANALASQGTLAYSGQANQNQMNQANSMAQAGLEGGGFSSILHSLFGGGGNNNNNNNNNNSGNLFSTIESWF